MAGPLLALMAVANMLYTAGDANLGGWTFGARATSATYYDSTGIVRTVGNNVARDAHFLGGVQHLLLEINRTNGVLQSQDFTNAAWNKNGCTVAANVVVAPDGTTTGNSMTALNGVNATCQAYQFISGGLNSKPQACAFFLAKGGKTVGQVGLNTAAGGTLFAYFDLTTGSVLATDAGVSAAAWPISFNGGIGYRCEAAITGTAFGTGPNGFYPRAGFCDASGSPQCTGDGVTVSGYVWGGHGEANVAWPSSYIPTTAAPATRNFESMTKPHNSIPQARTFYYDGTAIVKPQAGSAWLIIGAGNDRAGFAFGNQNTINGANTEMVNRGVGAAAVQVNDFSTNIGNHAEARCSYDQGLFSRAGALHNSGTELVSGTTQGTTSYNNAYGATTYTISTAVNQHPIAIRRLADILGAVNMQACRDAFLPAPAPEANPYSPPVWNTFGDVDKRPWYPRIPWRKFK